MNELTFSKDDEITVLSVDIHTGWWQVLCASNRSSCSLFFPPPILSYFTIYSCHSALSYFSFSEGRKKWYFGLFPGDVRSYNAIIHRVFLC